MVCYFAYILHGNKVFFILTLEKSRADNKTAMKL